VFVTVCQVVVFGAFGWSGSHLDLVTSILVPLLFVVALATAVHVQMRFLAERAAGGDAREALRRTVRAKAWPVFWTGATTALGFGSLAVARLPAIRSLGLGSAFAFAFMTLAALTLLPVLLGLGAGRTPARSTGRHRRSDRRWGKRGAELAIRFRRWTFIAFGGVAALALGGTFRLGEEGGILEYFRPQHPVRTQLRQLEAAGMDVVTAELVLTAQGSFFEQEESLRRLRELSRRLEALPRVSGAFGAGDLVAATAASLPGSPGLEASLEAIRAIPDIDQMLRYFLARQGSRTRITLRLPMEDSGVLEPILAAAQAAAVESFPEPSVEVTGRYPLVLAARRSLSTTMVLSLGLTLLAVAGVFRWLLGSSALTLRVLLPNLWPVAVVLGAMGWGGVALDPTTVIVAAAILGLAVDDTFHTLGSFRQGLASCDPPAAAVRSLDELAGAHALSSLVLAAGFGACAFSSFVPVGRFGALAVLGVAASLAGDLWLVPALLSGLSRRELSGLRRADDGGA
ncbi:MAG: MMPL family transporter, partial [Acidobacteria bacterium]|nr:MMPL family transporter [Acidobacteriota bacterium]